jgi:antitoxin CptB
MLAGILGVSIMWLLNGEGDGLEGPEMPEEMPDDMAEILKDLRKLKVDQAQLAERLARLEKRLRLAVSGPDLSRPWRDAGHPAQAAEDAGLAPGIKEMDLILGGWADAHLAGLDDATLDAFEAVLAEADQDLYSWVSGQAEPPASLAPMLTRIAAEFRPARSFNGIFPNFRGISVAIASVAETIMSLHAPLASDKTGFLSAYLDTLSMVERLHRLLLDVIKDEFERVGVLDINAVQALCCSISATTR